ncbi:MAG TPA: GGDEF domain-containing protein, partial [Rectinemataceae bacterium]|nr:GGDEF domain-containing protein [Rectinemataceae bacterium]
MDDAAISVEELLAREPNPTARAVGAVEWLSANFRKNPHWAKSLAERELAHAIAGGATSSVAWIRFYIGWIHIDEDDYEAALKVLDEARADFEQCAEPAGTARTFNAIGAAYLGLGIYDLALDYFERCTECAEALDRPDMAGAALINTADCLYELERYGEALEVIERSFEYKVFAHNESVRHQVAGMIYRALGRREEAEEQLLSGLAKASGVDFQSVESIRALAELYLDQARFQEAQDLIERGLEVADRVNDRLHGAQLRLVRAKTDRALGRKDRALEDIRAAIATTTEVASRKGEADAYKAYSEALRDEGDFEASLEALLHHYELKDSIRTEQLDRRIVGIKKEQARREEVLFRERLEQLSILGEIGRRITSSLDLVGIAEAVRSGAARLAEAPILLLGTGTNRKMGQFVVVEEGKPAGSVHGGDSALEAIAARCLSSGLEELEERAEPEGSVLGLPLAVGDRVVGALCVRCSRIGAYDKARLEGLRAVAAYAAIALENHRLFRQVEELASIDPLTGLLNRRSLLACLEEEYRQRRRYGRDVAVVIIDLDRFKSVNDSYGHEAGDLVLVSFADILKRVSR